MSFFFTKSDSKTFKNKALLHQLECKICPLYNLESNQHKDIKPHGAANPLIYILGIGPGPQEDAQGQFWIGPSGQLLKSQFSESQLSQIRFGNITRTRDPSNNPSQETIECCRPSVEKDIATSKPKAIFGMGELALKWATNSEEGFPMVEWRGHRLPVKIKDHICWFFPMYHPAYIFKTGHLGHVFNLDIKAAWQFLDRKIEPEFEDTKKLYDGVNLLYKVDDILSALKRFTNEPVTSVDLETNKIRPYAAGAKILSISLGTPEYSIAFPWDHPQATWSVEDKKRLTVALIKFFCSQSLKVAHNLAFELEWLAVIFNCMPILDGNWEDTMAAAYCLGFGGRDKKGSGDDQTSGLLSLDDLCLLNFGFFLKPLSNIDRNNLEREPIEWVLKYNALDTKYDAKLYLAQKRDIEYIGLQSIYHEQNVRIPTIVLTQIKGLYHDAAAVQEFDTNITKRTNEIYGRILATPVVIEYRTKFGKFNPGSPSDVAGLFKYMGFNTTKEDTDGTIRNSADEEVLNTIDHPLAKDFLELREWAGLKSKYIDLFTSGSIIYPDGKLHPAYTSLFTATGRLSARYPNVQNFPKKKHKEIRKVLVAPPGFKFASVDFGQIEFRVMAMISQDKKLVEYIWGGHDVHADWSLNIAKKVPKRVGPETLAKWIAEDVQKLKDKDKIFKLFRDVVKNNWVFAAFYGAADRSLARYMNIPEHDATELYTQFWEEFSGMRTWQKKTQEFYKEKGYVETLTGRYRYAYMQGGEIINSPIQGSASDIVIDAMNRLSKEARKTGKWQYQAVLNIHDDLSFYLPEETWENDLKHIVTLMLDCKYPFINVPLTVEASVGSNWFNLKEYGTFASNKLDQIKDYTKTIA